MLAWIAPLIAKPDKGHLKEALRLLPASARPQSTVPKHLLCLRDCWLVDYHTEGRQSFYADPPEAERRVGVACGCFLPRLHGPLQFRCATPMT